MPNIQIIPECNLTLVGKRIQIQWPGFWVAYDTSLSLRTYKSRHHLQVSRVGDLKESSSAVNEIPLFQYHSVVGVYVCSVDDVPLRYSGQLRQRNIL